MRPHRLCSLRSLPFSFGGQCIDCGSSPTGFSAPLFQLKERVIKQNLDVSPALPLELSFLGCTHQLRAAAARSAGCRVCRQWPRLTNGPVERRLSLPLSEHESPAQ